MYSKGLTATASDPSENEAPDTTGLIVASCILAANVAFNSAIGSGGGVCVCVIAGEGVALGGKVGVNDGGTVALVG